MTVCAVEIQRTRGLLGPSDKKTPSKFLPGAIS